MESLEVIGPAVPEIRCSQTISRNRPHGGAITGVAGKCGAEVRPWYPGSVCGKFGSDRTSGAGD